jgi:hypothetical protein
MSSFSGLIIYLASVEFQGVWSIFHYCHNFDWKGRSVYKSAVQYSIVQTIPASSEPFFNPVIRDVYTHMQPNCDCIRQCN